MIFFPLFFFSGYYFLKAWLGSASLSPECFTLAADLCNPYRVPDQADVNMLVDLELSHMVSIHDPMD